MEDNLSWDDLFPFMTEVKALARGLLRREHQASLQTTGLVLTALRRQRLTDQDWQSVTWPNRQYFFGAMYRAMTRALLDHARVRARRRELPVGPEDLQFDDLPQTLAREPALVVARSCTCSVRIIGLDLSAAVHATMTKPAMVPPTGLTGPCEALLCCR
jgi:hypothetical protein